MVIFSYPKRLFDKMISEKKYSENDSFISIGYTFVIENPEFWDDDSREPESGRFLRICFDDVVMDMQNSKAMTLEQGHEIIDFIKDHKGGNIHVHCQMGQSRSVAVAEFLTLYFRQHNVDYVEVYHYNPIVNPNKLVTYILNQISCQK